jgi:phosphocarrier protein HPr
LSRAGDGGGGWRNNVKEWYGTFEIRNRLGMHARAATAFVQMANRYNAEIRIRKGKITVNGKSIMGVLQLAASQGQKIELLVSGTDGEQALTELGRLIEDGFGEDKSYR